MRFPFAIHGYLSMAFLAVGLDDVVVDMYVYE
jgi:hypothetical protein